jgi:hypothetical protein
MESMAFVELSPCDAGAVPTDFSLAEYEGVTIRLSASNLLVGTLQFLAPNSFLNDLAATILHADPSEVSSEGRVETCLELINMIAGGFCRSMVSSDGLFELGLPSPINRNAVETRKLIDEGVLLALDDGKLLIACFSQQTH